LSVALGYALFIQSFLEQRAPDLLAEKLRTSATRAVLGHSLKSFLGIWVLRAQGMCRHLFLPINVRDGNKMPRHSNVFGATE
jgi:hypothetical protein